ncbi:hypothetical protein BDF20DRAFT_833888 [Mycotypha africana]|uniref:uncharacterized protein n=1 Tax=Mycotypha africana TaxID=64632 RepID=UPI0023015BB2|nr:uncharacterized protein BDF20DRAFT_833888 [Mycotypha africana]KAI8984379.1 hypothetical protein BDF20DRAFT_833888 [Mycotypha africana]
MINIVNESYKLQVKFIVQKLESDVRDLVPDCWGLLRAELINSEGEFLQSFTPRINIITELYTRISRKYRWYTITNAEAWFIENALQHLQSSVTLKGHSTKCRASIPARHSLVALLKIDKIKSLACSSMEFDTQQISTLKTHTEIKLLPELFKAAKLVAASICHSHFHLIHAFLMNLLKSFGSYILKIVMEKSSTRKQLTKEQLELIASNKAKALERLKAKRRVREAEQATTDASNNPDNVEKKDAAPQPKKARWIKSYYEYDLSKMMDSKGGYIVDEKAEGRELQNKKDKTYKVEPYFPPSLLPQENPKCKECSSMDLDPIFFNVFHILLCPSCKEKYPEKYSLLTKTEAKEDYLLTDRKRIRCFAQIGEHKFFNVSSLSLLPFNTFQLPNITAELKDEELLPHWKKPNPHKSTWNDMMLYVRETVEEYAFKKWNGPEGLDAEYERRQAQKKEKKEKKFKEKLADLRRRTMTSEWERKRQEGPHKHEFGESVQDNVGNTTQTCKTCGLVIESEEF